ncbi:MAG: 7-carboxy-7-deazaguanine synthase QueE, partial [Bacteroides sp.]|nr:7-carboxy-7-deazaguanine synthase QueE [Bacteroides sp.]
MRKINEIFYSLQGEGYHTGTPAVFVRFSGCNLKCPFCDTQHEEGTQMSDDEILEEVGKYPATTVILTGGEPSLWIDRGFIELLHRAGKYVCIETNGTRLLPDNIDWVTCSPKQGGELRITR